MPKKESFDGIKTHLIFNDKMFCLSKDANDVMEFYWLPSSAFPSSSGNSTTQLNLKREVTVNDLLEVDKEGLTLIHRALDEKKGYPLIKALIDLSTEKVLLKVNRQGETALHIAVGLQRLDIVGALLKSVQMTPKVFFKPIFPDSWTASRMGAEKVKEMNQHLPSKERAIVKSKSWPPLPAEVIPEAARPVKEAEIVESKLSGHDVALAIHEALAVKEQALIQMRIKPQLTKEQEELGVVLDKLHEKVDYLFSHKHIAAASAIRNLEINLRSLSYDSWLYPNDDETKMAREYKQGCKKELNRIFENAPAMAQINQHRGIKAIFAWLVGFFYDVNKPENRNRFFTPRTDTSKTLDEMKGMLPGFDEPSKPS